MTVSRLVLQSSFPRTPFTVEETTIADIHAAFAGRSLDCEQLTGAYLRRIAAYDDAGPALTH